MACHSYQDLKVVSCKGLVCNGCGTCCTVYGNVNLHISDIVRISDHLGIDSEDFFKDFCEMHGADTDGMVYALKIDGGCRFRVDGKCSIYGARPDACRAYPFSIPCINRSESLKKDFVHHSECFIHSIEDGLVVVPDIEGMVQNHILQMIDRVYMTMYGKDFDGAEAVRFHKNGMDRLNNQKMKDMVRKKLLYEFLENSATNAGDTAPGFTADQVTFIYGEFAKGDYPCDI